MRPLPVTALLASLVGSCSPISRDDAAEACACFERHAGDDLRGLGKRDKDRLNKVLAAWLPEAYWPYDHPWAFEPWRVWRRDEPEGAGGYLLFQVRPCFMLPGGSWAAVHLFTGTGRLARTVLLATGYRMTPEEASARYDPAVGAFVIEVVSVGEYSSVVRQFYGVRGVEVVLLRLEDEGGRPLANDYYTPHFTFGPEVASRAAEEWEEALASADQVRVLEALVWLGGRHRENLTPAPDVRRRVADLARSESRWVREAATLALKEMGPR
jgi:hypothetical protein